MQITRIIINAHGFYHSECRTSSAQAHHMGYKHFTLNLSNAVISVVPASDANTVVKRIRTIFLFYAFV